ncbi:MAG: trypsin-like serine protease [Anaerolineae bacterium]|nr:trypsin-like serine protease [Anaerolineae bacterium]
MHHIHSISRFLLCLTICFLILGLSVTSPAQAQDDDPVTPIPLDGNGKIVGGAPADPGEWPWQVALVSGNATILWSDQFCGGVLIAHQWVLTAGHCVTDNDGILVSPTSIDVVAGIYDLWTPAPGYQRRDVIQIIRHPNYTNDTLHNDIALLKLASPITLGGSGATKAYVLPLVTSSSGNLAGMNAWVTGWGYTESEPGWPDELYEVQVPIYSNTVCNDASHYNGAILDSMLCAGYDSGQKDSCHGDSGGPLVVSLSGQWQLAGIVSWGDGCAEPLAPGVYTRVSSFTDWIQSYVQLPLAYEPNDSAAAATLITSGQPQTHSIFPADDQDWVKFELTNESLVALETSGTSSEDTRLWLYDSSLNELEFNDNGGDGNYSQIDRVCNIDSLSAGTYYVKVDEAGNNAEIPAYILSYKAIPCPAVAVDVTIAGESKEIYYLAKGTSTQANYTGLFGGPIIVEGSDPTTPIVAGLRDLWTDDKGSQSSYTQIFGMPTSLLSNKYVFPTYSNVVLNEQLRIANVGTEATNVTVTIGGQVQGDPITIQPNQQYVVNYPGLFGGPVIVEGSKPNVPIIAGLRDLWTDDRGNRTSYSQIFGVPVSLLSNKYVFPTYSNIVLNEQLRIANVGTEATNVTVTIGGQVQGDPITIQPNQQYVVNYPGLFGGPVIVEGSKPNVPIIAGMRDLWTDDTGNRTSYTQIFGIPTSLLSNKYAFPAYNNISVNEQLRIANVGTEATNVTVTIGGQVQGDPITIQPNQQYVVNYPGVSGGPIVVEGSNPSVPIIAGLRDLWTNSVGNRTSYAQIFGIPASLWADLYVFPTYSNIVLNEQLRIGVP